MSIPRIMIAAPASGGGKTLTACGIMRALTRRGMTVAPFKCGPDYIDPLHHAAAAGRRSGNLDPFFLDRETMRERFAADAAGGDIAVIEAAMGYYDGFRPDSPAGSAHDVAGRLECPTVLVVDGKGAAFSAVPVVAGFADHMENSRIVGVVFNNMSAKVYAGIAPAVEALGVKPLGHIPRMPRLSLGSRHLGLLMPDEIAGLDADLDLLAAKLEETVDLDAVVALAAAAPPLPSPPASAPPAADVRIAVADDAAFRFIYEDNLEMLRAAGAEIVRFSPLRDPHPPDGIAGLILPGGYPELHAGELSGNRGMRDAIREAIAGGMPYLAEAGGFAYLHEELVGADGGTHAMAGVYPGRAGDAGRLVRFGYVELESLSAAGVLPRGCKVRGHEFRRLDSDAAGMDAAAVKTDGSGYRCLHIGPGHIAGFPQLYLRSSPGLAERFADACRAYNRDI